MKNLKKLLALVLAIAMAAAFTVSVYATEVTSDGGTGETLVELTADAATFSVTVPTSIAIKVNSNGSVTCPSNVQIINESTAAVKVTKVDMKNGTWTLVPYTTDMATQLVDSKKLAFQMTVGTDTVATTTTGNQTLTHVPAQWTMPQKDATLTLACAAKASAVSSAIAELDKQTAASIVFTVAWAN